MISDPILVWKFDDAPKEYQELSEHGGDEDWLAIIPANYDDEYIGWMDDGTSFSAYKVTRQKLKDGRVLVIGAHS